MTSDSASFLIAILLGLLMVILAWSCRRITGHWAHPASLFPAYWALTSIMPILIFDIPIRPYGIFIFFIMSLMFSLGAVSFSGKLVTQSECKGKDIYNTNFMQYSLYTISFTSLVMLIINSQLQGINIDRIFSFDSAAEYAQMRYSGTLVSNIFLQISTVLAYLSAAIGGIILPGKNQNRLFVLLFSLAPVIFVLMTQSAKGSFILSVAILLGSSAARILNDEGRLNLNFQKFAPKLFIYGIIGFILIGISFISRGANIQSSFEEIQFALERSFLSYSFGHVYSFDDWASSVFGDYSQQYYRDGIYPRGFMTFSSIFYLFGVNPYVPPGTYQEYFQYQDILQTNIYTLYRGLINDFTIVGAALFMFLAGLFFGKIFSEMVKGKNLVSLTGYIVFIAFMQQSIYVSIFQYNSIYIFAISLAIILKINRSMAHG